MLEIRFSPKAVTDLDEIKRYISSDLCNPQAATDLLSLIFQKIQTLATLPQIGAKVKTDLPSLKIYRFIPCKNYLVFYRQEEKFVSIIRVLYAKRDYLRLLESDRKPDEND